jgi:DNA processing protein
VTKDQTTYEKQLAVAVSLAKPAARFELTRRVVEERHFGCIAEYLSAGTLREAHVIVEQSEQLGLRVWPLTGDEYPEVLKHIDDPPSVLYVRCCDDALTITDVCLAVVGRRAAGVETCSDATRIAQELAESGFTIVSGLALGVDAAAHRGALQTDLQCPTIAVLAHGLDRVYPASHHGLAQQIVNAGGILLSEYAPGVTPMRHHFLARNRIIAGLSRGVVVVEAGKRSGSLVTAQFAADYGRDVFVVQGALDDESREGGENLLAQGAISITGAHEVLAEYGMKSKQSMSCASLDDWHITTVEELQQAADISARQLLELELAGQLERLPGNRIRIARSAQRKLVLAQGNG